MAKVTAIPDKISKSDFKYSISPFEYYFSYLNENYMSYNLSLYDRIYNYMSIELIFSSDEIDYALYTDKSEDIFKKVDLFFHNETNGIKLVDERYQDGKRSLIIFIEKDIKEIYLIIFIKEKIDIKENNFFCFKYYYFSKEEYNK